jgi:hypothetical protein
MMRNFILNCTPQVALALLVSLGAQTAAHAQDRGAERGPPPTAEATAPVDFTGYWESIVQDEDWVYRMVTPRPGDYAGVPLNPAGIKVMEAWDPARDTAAGEQCKSYGAPAIMRVPGHLHVTWQDPQTLKMETDTGQQTRLLHFVPSMADEQGPRTWQGYSVAQWELQRQGGGFFGGGKPVWASLKVTTTNLKAGYLRKNGVPYSETARVVEYFDLADDPQDVQDPKESGGQALLVVTSVVTDPVYLFSPFVTDDNFVRLSSDAGWKPSACSAMW